MSEFNELRRGKLAKVLEFSLPRRHCDRARRHWILSLSEHALSRGKERGLFPCDLFAALWLGSALRVRGDNNDDFRVSFLFQDVVVIAAPSPGPSQSEIHQWAEDALPTSHILNDPARRVPWSSARQLSLHSIITTYRRAAS